MTGTSRAKVPKPVKEVAGCYEGSKVISEPTSLDSTTPASLLAH